MQPRDGPPKRNGAMATLVGSCVTCLSAIGKRVVFLENV